MNLTESTALPGPSGAEQRSSAGRRVPELDGVRGLAIALVLVYHYVRVNSGKKTLDYAFLPTHLMWSGVDLFFVLSGLLIGGILLDYRESPNYYSVFYARRIHRIFPIYYLMIALLFLGLWAFPTSPLFRGTMPLWAFPLYAQNLLGDFTRAPVWIGVSWSLAVEEQFYLIFPFIVRLLSRRVLIVTVAAIIVGAPILRTALVFNGWAFEQVYPLLPCRADALALGVCAALILRSEEAKRWVRKNSKRLYCTALLLLASCPTMLKWTTYRYVGTIGYSIVGVMYFLLITLLLISPLPFMQAAFSARWLRWLGTVSYCAYLIHEPVRAGLLLLSGLRIGQGLTDLKAVLVTTAALVITLAIAQVSWVFLERPLIRRAHIRYQY